MNKVKDLLRPVKPFLIFCYVSIVRILSVLATLIAFVLTAVIAIVLRIYRSLVKRKQLKVFLGGQEIPNNITSMEDCLSKQGIDCEVLMNTSLFYIPKGELKKNFKVYHITGRPVELLYDIILPFYFIHYLLTRNVFLFVWSRSFFWLNLDYIILRLAKTDLILMHCGDDVRYRPLQKVIDASMGHSFWNETSDTKDFIRKFYLQFISERTGKVISFRDQATFQSRPLVFFKFPQFGFRKEAKQTNERPLILHCPSARSYKRTDVVLAAIELLKKDGPEFDFELIEGKHNSYVLQRLGEADILVDQPGTWVARLAMEAMSQGCCVVGGNRREYVQRFDSPVIQFEADAEKLAGELKQLILNKVYRQEKMNACFSFWKENYSYQGFLQYFKDVLENKAQLFDPLPNQKQLLLSGATGSFQKTVIRIFYRNHYNNNSLRPETTVEYNKVNTTTY